MIAGGVGEIKVIKRPVVGIIPTGDEIIPPCASPEPGQILEFNSAIFSSMLRAWGAESITYPIVPDKYDMILGALNKALEECDVVLLNAGSSAGRDDYSAKAIAQAGQVLYHGIAMKPGKPAILGCKGNKPILGVPGYPVSGIIVIEELLRPLIDICMGRGKAAYQTAEAVLTRPVVSGLKYQEFVRVRLGRVGDKLTASPPEQGQRRCVLLYEGGRHTGSASGPGGLRSGGKGELFCSGTPCPLHSCRYLAIQTGGVIAENDQIRKEDRL